MQVKLSTIRTAWKRAKMEFRWDQKYGPVTPDVSKKFYSDFGAAHNMIVIIDEFKSGFPVITTVEFKDEKSYMWFILKWS